MKVLQMKTGWTVCIVFRLVWVIVINNLWAAYWLLFCNSLALIIHRIRGAHEGKQHHDVDKLLKFEQQKIPQSRNKITKIREGFESGLYDLNDAKSKVNGYMETVNKAEREIKRLTEVAGGQHTGIDPEE